MNEAQPVPEHMDALLFPIRTVSRLTGVNAVTLRAWERRHGLIQPLRKPSGHRLYSQDHIDLILQVRGLLNKGLRIGQVKSHLQGRSALATPAAIGDEQLSRPADIWNSYINHMVSAVVCFDEGQLEDNYGEAMSLYPVELVTRKLLTPLLITLGDRWESGEGSVAEEHFFGCFIRNKLGARFHHRVRSTQGPRLILCCIPGERHEVGLMMLALAANEAGFQVILLGSDMPMEDLPEAVRRTHSAAILLSGLLAPEASVLETSLPALVRDAGVPVFMGGLASVSAFNEITHAGAEPLGTDIATGLSHLQHALGIQQLLND